MFHTKKPHPTMEKIATPLLAGAVAAAYNHMNESQGQYKTAMSFLRYGGICAVANAASTMLTGFVLPEFHNERMRNIQHMALGAAGTSFLNVVAQSQLQSPQDLRTMHNAIAGGLGGGAAPILGHQLLTMF